MEKEICNVICIEKEQDRKAVIELTENQDSVTIKFSLGKLVLKKEGDNYFDTLIKLREELEKLNCCVKAVVKMFIHLECYYVWVQDEMRIH